MSSTVYPPEADARRSDAELVAAARRGGDSASDAFGELVTRYDRMVYAIALSLVREPADASDVAQDAFVRALRNLDLLADPSRFGAWLRRITFGVAVDRVRAERARIERRRGPAAGSLGRGNARAHALADSNTHEVADGRPTPLEELERAEIRRRVLSELDRLPARYRVPFTLFHVDGLSHARVAAALGAPEGTVRSLVTRARRKLAALLANSPEVRDMAPDAGTANVLDVFDDSTPRETRILHLLNGDVVRETLERSKVTGAFAPYADILHEGPVLRVTDTPSWRETRARFIAAAGYGSFADALRTYERWDAQLAMFGEYDEVVLWFEHDLFDQLLLVRHLDWFARRELGPTKLSLICVGEFPGFADFHGLGQLDANQLASLVGTRHPVSRRQLEIGRRVWKAFTAADPRQLATIVRSPGDIVEVLPFLPGALARLLEEYPSVDNGLPRTERHILECVAEGAMDAAQLFRAEQAREDRVFMGDWVFWSRVRALAAGPSPLVRLDVQVTAAPDIPSGTVSITDAGRDVLLGRKDWIASAGFDRWIGGVHLEAPLGGDVAWRYDPTTGLLVRRGSP